MTKGTKVYIAIMIFILSFMVGYMLTWKYHLNEVDKNLHQMQVQMEQQKVEYNQIRQKYINDLGDDI